MNFNYPNLPYGFSVETINESLIVGLQQIRDRGWQADMLVILPDDTEGPDIDKWLSTNEPYDVIVAGAGIRIPVVNMIFFEAVINALHRSAPNSTIAFDTRPEETADATARWLNALKWDRS